MRISLKVLNEKPDTVYRCSDHPDRCSKCSINVSNGGRCLGCSAEKLGSCQQSSCDLGCNVCGGFKVKVPAVCCKSPTAKTFLIQASGNGDYQQPKYRFTKQSAIHFKNRAVVVARGGGVRTTQKSPYIDEVNCIAATIKDVWSKKGFYSKDLKDYLRIPASKKLMLITAQLDDWLEKVWDMEAFGGEEYTAHGIDYWMPPAFSSYLDDANMNRYWQMLRTLLATQNGKGHFVTLPKTKGLVVDDLFLEALDKIPHATFNCQFAVVNEVNFKRTLANIKYWHLKAPEDISFWFIGVSTPKFCHNVKNMCPGRETYFVSANPFRLSNHGKELLLDGTTRKRSDISKEDLVYINQKVFSDIVARYS